MAKSKEVSIGKVAPCTLKNGCISFGAVHPKDLTNLSELDITEIMVWDAKSRNKVANLFKNICDELKIDFEAAKKCLQDDWVKSVTRKEADETSVIQKERPKTTMEELNPTKIEELVMATVLMGHYDVENQAWILVVGAPSSGKTRAFSLVDDERLVHWGSKATTNALIPGVPDAEVVPTKGVLERCNHKCLVYNESSVFFSGNKDKVTKQVAEFTDAYSGEMAIDDAGNPRRIKCHFTALWGMATPKYKQNIDLMANFGLRFLVFLFPTNRSVVHWNDDNKEDRKSLVVSKILETIEKNEEFETDVPLGVKDEIEDFARKITILRSLGWAKWEEEAEGLDRLAQQLRNLVVARAMLWGRAPNLEDVAFVKPLAVATIPLADAVMDIANHPGEQIYQNAIAMGVIVDNKLAVEWEEFFSVIRGMEVMQWMQNDADMVAELGGID
jgi:hypothetical protein